MFFKKVLEHREKDWPSPTLLPPHQHKPRPQIRTSILQWRRNKQSVSMIDVWTFEFQPDSPLISDGIGRFELGIEIHPFATAGVFWGSAPHFEKVAEGDCILRCKMEAQFYLACTYLAQGKQEEAKKLLQSVSSQRIEPCETQVARLLEVL